MSTSGCLPDPERVDGHGLPAQGQTGHGPSHLRHHVAPVNKLRRVRISVVLQKSYCSPVKGAFALSQSESESENFIDLYRFSTH